MKKLIVEDRVPYVSPQAFVVELMAEVNFLLTEGNIGDGEEDDWGEL